MAKQLPARLLRFRGIWRCQLSAEQVAGPRTPGKASGDIRYHGSQPGCVRLADREVQLKRPRLRHKTDGEAAIPAYEALRKNRDLSQYMLGALMRGISTREYHEVLPRMAETVGVSRSAVSRQAIEASVEQLRQLQERRWDQVEILVIYIDGQRFADHHILSAVGVDVEGHKHVLGSPAGPRRTRQRSCNCSLDCATAGCRPTANT
ncbi:MAG: transposase [Bryobacteraceae bacterium]|nr:transposase [Bryobacteraceae bacterium]